MRLRKLFEFVGDRFGISVEVVTTDGRQPVGCGIGPVLEARDVMAVLANDPKAPPDLREKSLRLAARLLEYDPQLRGGAGRASPGASRQRGRSQTDAENYRRTGIVGCRRMSGPCGPMWLRAATVLSPGSIACI